jgi:SRSO17 transposase
VCLVRAAKAQAPVGGPAAVLIVDDAVLLEQGRRSVGVARQYAGATTEPGAPRRAPGA